MLQWFLKSGHLHLDKFDSSLLIANLNAHAPKENMVLTLKCTKCDLTFSAVTDKGATHWPSMSQEVKAATIILPVAVQTKQFFHRN